MKILFILEYYYPNIGGVEKLFKHLTESLAQNNHEILVITSRFDKSLPKNEIINNVKIKRLNLNNRFLFTFFSIFSILKYAKQYELIHTTSYNAAFPAWIAAKILRKQSVITFHEVWGNLWNRLPYLSRTQKFLFSQYEQFILKLKFDFYISVSEFTKKELITSGIDKQRIIKIYNGINKNDYKTIYKNPPKEFTFTYFGRLGVSKGLNLILPAAKLFLDKYPSCNFKLIIPQTPKALYLEILNEIQDLNLNKNVKMMHHLSFEKLTEEVANSSCILIPSYSEGFCFTAVESNALGVPVITSGLGALKETVSGKHILLEDHTSQGIFDALEKAYHNQYQFKKEKNFDFNDSLKDYLKFYQNLDA
jgi:glycosyltransferase involved in cell wall biosynthesis